MVGAAAAIGYLLGTRAGLAKWEHLKARADEFAHSPQVADAVRQAANEAKKHSSALPDPLASMVKSVADTVVDTATRARRDP